MPGANALPVLRLAWQPERADLADAFRVLRRLNRNRELPVLMGVVAVVAGLWTLGVPVGPALPFAVLVVALVVLPLHPLTARLAWRRDPRQRTARAAEVAPGEGLSLTIGDVASAYRWSAFSGLVETERHYLLTLPRGRRTSVLSLPKRAVAPGDADLLRTVLLTALGEPARVG